MIIAIGLLLCQLYELSFIVGTYTNIYVGKYA